MQCCLCTQTALYQADGSGFCRAHYRQAQEAMIEHEKRKKSVTAARRMLGALEIGVNFSARGAHRGGLRRG